MEKKPFSGCWTVRIDKRKSLLIALCAFLCVITVLLFKFQIVDFLARWLCVGDVPVPCEVILVMGGKAERRVPFAMELLQKGFGKKMIIVTGRQDSWVQEAEKKLGVKNFDRAYIEALIEATQLSPETYVILTDSLSTLDDAKKFRDYYDRHPFSSAIVVTDPVHSRRSMHCIRRCFRGTGVHFVPYPLPREGFSEKFSHRDDYINYVVEEYLRLFFYCSGFKKND
jgi:uncharacterized SAM-binding protein YcdF (DUF218 family)